MHESISTGDRQTERLGLSWLHDELGVQLCEQIDSVAVANVGYEFELLDRSTRERQAMVVKELPLLHYEL